MRNSTVILMGVSFGLTLLISSTAAIFATESTSPLPRQEHRADIGPLEKQVPEWKYREEQARSLNFQRLLAKEERRTGDLDAQVRSLSMELKNLKAKCQKPEDN